MPLQIDRSGNVPGAVYLRPAVRTSGLFGPNFDEPKFPLQLRIIHDLVAQRFATGRDYLNNRLHSTLGSAGNQSFCNASLEKAPLQLIFKQRKKHDVNIDVSFFRMSKRAGQSANNFETELLP